MRCARTPAVAFPDRILPNPRARFGITPRSLVLLAILVVAAGIMWRSIEANRRPQFATTTLAVERGIVSGPELKNAADSPPRSPEVRYLERANALRKQAAQDQRVNYLQVIQAAYEPGAITASTLARKAAYRNHMATRLVFFADYSALRDEVSVQEGRAVYDRTTRLWVSGMHDGADNVIVLAKSAPAYVLFHEAGHGLQRKMPHLVVDAQRSYEAFREGRIDDAAERVLRYLADQHEFETFLQDLNRFNATLVSGVPIMKPADTVRALSALGMPLAYEEVRDAFAEMDEVITDEDFATLRATPRISAARTHTAFAPALALVRLRDLALQGDPASWPLLLRKIIFEAPGHV